MPTLKTTFSNPARTPVSENSIKEHLEKILTRLDLTSSCEVDITIVGSQQIQELNKKWRHIDKPTDVLSFPNNLNLDERKHLGSIVICGSIALKQAQQAGTSLQAEINQLAAHGLLHLLGYDHF